MAEPSIAPVSLAEVNEFANAEYAGALLPGGRIVPREWCTTAPMRGYVISAFSRDGAVATAETALWIHTGRTSMQLQRKLDFAYTDSSAPRGAPRAQFPPSHLTRIGSQTLTTAERTAIDLMAKDPATGVQYALELVRSCPDCTLESIIECSYEVRSKRNIEKVRAIFHQLADALNSKQASTAQ